jgi:hypothetical protein
MRQLDESAVGQHSGYPVISHNSHARDTPRNQQVEPQNYRPDTDTISGVLNVRNTPISPAHTIHSRTATASWMKPHFAVSLVGFEYNDEDYGVTHVRWFD